MAEAKAVFKADRLKGAQTNVEDDTIYPLVN